MARITRTPTVEVTAYLETRGDWVVEVSESENDPLFTFGVANIPKAAGFADKRRALDVDHLARLLFAYGDSTGLAAIQEEAIIQNQFFNAKWSIPTVEEYVPTPGLGATQVAALIQEAFFRVDANRLTAQFLRSLPSSWLGETYIPPPSAKGSAKTSSTEEAVRNLVGDAVIALLAHDGINANCADVDSLVSHAVALLRFHTDGADWSGHMRRFDVDEMALSFIEIEDAEQALEFFRVYGPLDVWEPIRRHAIRLSQIRERVRRHINFLEHGSVRPTNQELLFAADSLGFTRHVNTRSQIEKSNHDMVGDLALTKLDSMDAHHSAPFVLEVPYSAAPISSIVCKTVEEGMRAFGFLNKLRGTKLLRCANERCGKLFKERTSRSRMCGSKCTSAVSSRNSYANIRPSEKGRTKGAKTRRRKLKA